MVILTPDVRGIAVIEEIKTEIYTEKMWPRTSGNVSLYIAKTGSPIQYFCISAEASVKLAQDLLGDEYVITKKEPTEKNDQEKPEETPTKIDEGVIQDES